MQDQGGQVEHVDVEVVGGGGGEERDERVGGGEGLSKPSRRPVNWSVPRRRGLIPDGLVQARLSNFVVKFPNLGRVGSCNNNTSVGAKKTASCQLEKLEISGGKRKREAVNIKLVNLEDRETGGQPNKLSKYSFLPGNNQT